VTPDPSRTPSGLAGRTVAILEARRSAELAKLFEQRGARVYVAPALREETLDAGDAVRGFVDAVCDGSFDLLLCLTGVGVRGLFAAAERLDRKDELQAAVGRLPILCRGPKPVAALRTFGREPTYTTPSPYTTQQVLEIAGDLGLRGKRVGMVRHGGPSPELIAGLKEIGAEVREVQVYQWALPEDTHPIEGLIERLEAGAIDAVAFTSASQVQNLFAIAEQAGRAEHLRTLLRGVRAIVAVGPVSAAELLAHGLRVDVEPREPKMGPMVLAADAFLAQQIS
jgi:uroporphyrinogen-III synthase